jgi:ABC-type phosphate transport system substrate-binding protein
MTARLRHAFLLLINVAVFCAAGHAKQMAVVVDKSNTQSAISSADLAKILMLDTRKWQDGKSVVVVLSDPGSTDVQQVLQRLLKVSEDKARTLLAAHRDSILVVNSDEELLKRVASVPGAIGLIDVYSINSAVNVLKVDSKLPLEAGYPLR